MKIPSEEEVSRYEKLWIEDLTQQQAWSKYLAAPITEEQLNEQISKVKETARNIRRGGATAFFAMEKDIIFKINDICTGDGHETHQEIYEILREYIYDACGIKLDEGGRPLPTSEAEAMRGVEYERQVLRIGKKVLESPEGKRFFTRAHKELSELLVGALL